MKESKTTVYKHSITHCALRAQIQENSMQVHELLSFGAIPGKGNTALVIEDGPQSQAERQAFASAQNKGACVFLTPGAPGQPVEADFYYTHARSPLCLHATLAAAHILCARRPATLRTAMRGQLLELSHGPEGTFAAVRRQAVAPLGIDPGLPAMLLGEPGLVQASAPLLSSVGSPKLLIEVTDRAALHALRPPLERIVDWGKEHGVNGCYVYCRAGQDEYEGRNFNHLDPAKEDSATGVAAGALAAWLQRGLVMLQGENMGNPCRIVARVEGQLIFVGGATELISA
jgi:predicted PhzF superfamily epimerase YddE/YHI9